MNKSILVNGTFRSGSGAINDYLSSRTDFCNPFGEKEFRLMLSNLRLRKQKL